MRDLFLLLILISIFSCNSNDDDTFLYDGHVFSYEEEEGSDVDIGVNILLTGKPVKGARLTLRQDNQFCESVLCRPVTDEDGYFQCELDRNKFIEDGGYYTSTRINSYSINHVNYDHSSRVNGSNDSRSYVVFNKTKVPVTVIDTTLTNVNGFVFNCRVYHSTVSYEGFSFYGGVPIINNQRIYRDTLEVMENVNLELSVSKKQQPSNRIKFFSGDKDNPTELIFYM